MTKSLANSFGFVFLFGVTLLLFCIQSQDNVIKVVAPRPWIARVAGNNNETAANNNNNDGVDPETTSIRTTNAVVENTFPSNTLSIEDVSTSSVTESIEKWPYDTPVVQGWEPDKSRNLSVYLQPEISTTLIKPRLSLNETVSALGQVHPKTHILIVCQSSFQSQGFELREAIRESWATDAKDLPVTVVFILGDPQNSTLQSELERESEIYGDILQESFIDAYNNLTLKSMFMLKFVTSFMNSTPPDSVKFLLKVDDDCYVNLKSLLKYTNILAKYSHTMVGHVLGEDSPVIRPLANSTERYSTKWEVPFYIYPDKETFPNALSGSGYLMHYEDLDCLYRRGLETPFVNLEDIFITGLAAKKCHLTLRSSPKFHFMGKHICHVRHQVLSNVRSLILRLGK